MPKKTSVDMEELTYEQLEKRMQEILAKVQGESTSLDEQIALGEEGQKVLSEMRKRLEALKAKVDKLTSSSTKGGEASKDE